MDNNKKNQWAIVQLHLVDRGLTYEQAALFHFIAKFEQKSGPVYASIPYIATQMRLSDRSVQRHIRTLIKLKFLKESSNGRNRWLSVNDAKLAGTHAKLAPIHAKLAPYDAKLAPDACQNGMLFTEGSTEDLFTENKFTEDYVQKIPSTDQRVTGKDAVLDKEAYQEFKKSLLARGLD